MRGYGLTALLAAVAFADPVLQDFDWDAIEQLNSPPTASIPIFNAAAAQTTVSFEPTVAAAAVSAAVLANPNDPAIIARGVPTTTQDPNQAQCTVTHNPNDTPALFQNNKNIPNTASNASTPRGYQLVYQNLNASSNLGFGYMGYSTLNTYNVQTCSSRCDAIVGCQSFNIYFERDPAEEPRANCTNPASITVIKCVYFSGPVTTSSAVNDGQWRVNFHVLIGGSNGYINTTLPIPTGYNPPVPLNNAAIFAPLDCANHDTYMGIRLFQTPSIFSISNCAAACSAQSDYNRAYPAADGSFQTCQFFNTYILYNASVAVGQACALYNESWPASFATNAGQFRGNDYFSVGYSFAFANTTAGTDQPKNCSNPLGP